VRTTSTATLRPSDVDYTPAPPAPAPPGPPPGWDLPSTNGSTGTNNPPAAIPPASPIDPTSRQGEHDTYKKRCTEQPPGGLSPCALAKWKLQRNIDCKNLMQAWDNKWFPGRHAQSINELNKGIEKLTKWIRDNCKNNDCK